MHATSLSRASGRHSSDTVDISPQQCQRCHGFRVELPSCFAVRIASRRTYGHHIPTVKIYLQCITTAHFYDGFNCTKLYKQSSCRHAESRPDTVDFPPSNASIANYMYNLTTCASPALIPGMAREYKLRTHLPKHDKSKNSSGSRKKHSGSHHLTTRQKRQLIEPPDLTADPYYICCVLNT